MRGLSALGIGLVLGAGVLALSPGVRAGSPLSDAEVVTAFARQGIRISQEEVYPTMVVNGVKVTLRMDGLS